MKLSIATLRAQASRKPAGFVEAYLSAATVVNEAEGYYDISDEARRRLRLQYLSNENKALPFINMRFEELCAVIETLPEPAKSAGQILANAKKIRISKAECSPCERSKAETALRTWLKTSGQQK